MTAELPHTVTTFRVILEVILLQLTFMLSTYQVHYNKSHFNNSCHSMPAVNTSRNTSDCPVNL